MSTRVIQGFFVGGTMRAAPGVARPAAPARPLQARTAPGAPIRPAGPPQPAFAPAARIAQPHGGNGDIEVDATRLGLVRSGGNPLPAPLLAKMEAAFDADFSAVRVHIGPQAARIGAIAFTTGNDLYFAPGRYQPESVQGQQLIGHELAHVIQQRQGRVRAPDGGVTIVQDRLLEAEADRMGMRAAQFAVRAPQGAAVQRRASTSRPPLQHRPVQRKAAPFRSGRALVQRMLDKDNSTRIDTLTELNDALRKLTPEITGVSNDHFGVRGVTLAMINASIAASHTVLYNGMRRRDIIDAIKDDLTARVNDDVPAYTYDTHGDKHFPGGAHGSKFTANQATVNPLIRALITPEIGRIRRDARGRNKNYYFTIAQATHAIAQCPNDLTIQITYKYATDEIEYHGYPDNNVLAYSLATAKNGADIPA